MSVRSKRQSFSSIGDPWVGDDDWAKAVVNGITAAIAAQTAIVAQQN
jgi:hypothetical protein